MKRYLVEYSVGGWAGLRISIKCETRADIRGILKRHLGNRDFHIDHITECNTNHTAPWYKGGCNNDRELLGN